MSTEKKPDMKAALAANGASTATPEGQWEAMAIMFGKAEADRLRALSESEIEGELSRAGRVIS